MYKASNRNTEGSTRYCTTQLGTEFIDNDSYTYTYDNVGNITSIKKGTRTSTNPEEAGFKTVSGAAAYRSYEYDALGQLKRENNKSKNATAEWNYDILGNIESTITYDYTTGDVGDRRTAIDYQYTNNGKAGWNKLLTTLVHKEYGYNTAGRYISKQTVEDIDYDEIGNPVSYNYTDYVYNSTTGKLEEKGTRTGPTLKWTGRELYRYQSDSFQNNYYYDADGLRSRKNIYTKNDSGSFEYAGKTMYQYLGSQLAYQCTYNATGAVDTEIYYFYDSYGKLTAMRYIKGSTDYNFYISTNAQGDVLGIYTGSGILKAAYEYDAWGNATVYKVTQDEQGNNIYTDITNQPNSTHIAAQNPIRYRGYYYDSDTGLYYLQSRYYNPKIGRFLNADKYLATGEHVLSLNMFAYCGNNPVMYSDPSGHWPEFINKIIDTVKSAISNIETAIQNIGVVQHNVPLYSQGDRPLCWAYSQTMVEDFQSGTQRTQEEADERAQEIAVSVHGEDNWNQGGWPTNIDSEASSTNIFALYWNLRDGPLYGHYGVSNTDGHMVVITGVSIFRDEVYTNNPWGVSGTQSFDEFCDGYVDLEGGNTGVPLIAAYTYE